MIDASVIDWGRVRALAAWSQRAYDSPNVEDESTRAAALVGMDGDRIVVAFRGSKAPRDFEQDAKFALKRFTAGAWVHEGFLENFGAIDARVSKEVGDLLAAHPGAKVEVTGHSLGGALAVLCGLEFAWQGFPLSTVCTFGQPRVGDAMFARLCDVTKVGDRRLGDLHLRFVNAEDIVPRSPSALMWYRHSGNEVWFPPDGSPAIDPSIWSLVKGDACGLYAAARKMKVALLDDHYLEAYIERLKDAPRG